MKHKVAAIFGLSCLSLMLMPSASASPEEPSLDEIEADCWNAAVLSQIPTEERETFIGDCINNTQDFLQGRVSDELEYAPPTTPEDVDTRE